MRNSQQAWAVMIRADKTRRDKMGHSPTMRRGVIGDAAE